MAKAVIVKHAGETISFAPTKVDRAKIYGARKRIAVDAAGRDCTRASLTADGSQLLVSGMTAQAYFTGEGRWVVALAGFPHKTEPIPILIGKRRRP